jgi:Protein of unknown function (DUF3037)
VSKPSERSTPAGKPGRHTSPESWVAYDFAVLRAVPHVYLGAFVPVGVVVHARTAEFLGIRALTDPAALAARVPDVDAELLARYLRSCEAICAGDPAAGPIALAPPSERFHWLTAPRSDVLQSSPVHEGLCEDPRRALEELFAEYVGAGRE